jgi:ATP-dependent protease ClpP protease subunit
MIISGHIGASWWDDSGTTSKEFREKFAAIPKGTKVNVRINSEGGSVSDALEMYNCIQGRKEDVTTFNDGYALSSASIILCAGGRVVTPHSSLTMIHEPWSMTVGDETDHIKAAQMLAKHGDTIAEIYARKTGKPAAEMRAAMRTETWFTGAEAAEFGFSETDPETETEELIEARVRKLDVAAFKNVPRHILDLVQGRKQVSTPAMAAADPKKTNLMDKKKILAALKARGVELAEDASDETILEAWNKLSQPPPPADPPADPPVAPPNNDAEVKALRKQLDDEKRIRVTAEIKRRGENKIENKNLNWWINLAMANETEVYAQIDSLPVNRPGGQPIGIGISIVENRLEEIRKEASPSKRYRTLAREWDGLIRDALSRDGRVGMTAPLPGGDGRMYPVASNTYSASLVTQFLLDGAVTKLQNLWAPLRVFTRDYSQDRYKPRATAQLKYVTAGGTTQKNASNFESGDATVTNVPIAVDQYSTAFHVTNDELNSGLRMENLVDVKTAESADNILKIAFAPLALASFTTNATMIRTASAFAFSDMATAWGQLKKSPIKFAVLDGEYMARIINSPVFYQMTGTTDGEVDGWKRFGWDGVWTNTNWTGTHAGAGDQYIRGLFCNPQVMGAVAGIPLTPPAIAGNTLQESTITVPDVNISIAAYSWFSLATRTYWMSYDLMFGTALLDESAGVLLASQ